MPHVLRSLLVLSSTRSRNPSSNCVDYPTSRSPIELERQNPPGQHLRGPIYYDHDINKTRFNKTNFIGITSQTTNH